MGLEIAKSVVIAVIAAILLVSGYSVLKKGHEGFAWSMITVGLVFLMVAVYIFANI